MFKLVIQDDEGKTTVVPLIRDEITIGRKEGNTIRLTERNVSRRHARILRNNGEVHIEDLGSYNGIRVNNSRIAERVSLRVSDQVQIGDYKLYLKAEGVEQVDDARTMPIERVTDAPGVSDNAQTDVIAAVAPAPTVPMGIPTTPTPVTATGGLAAGQQLIGNPNRTLVAIADTDPQGRPVASAAAVAAMSAPVGYGKLVVLSSNFAGKEFELSRPQMIVGRTDENDLVVNHRSISRNHAKLVREPDTGRYTISDLQSSNGVRVNGQDYGKVELRRGDVIDLGHVRLRFVEPGEDFVFARDAVITDVPDSGSRKGLLVAIILGLLVLGGAVVFFVTRKDETGKETATGSGSSGMVASGSDGSQVAIESPPDAPTQPTIGSNDGSNDDANRIALECDTHIQDKKWVELEECARNKLQKFDPTKAGVLISRAKTESEAEVALRDLKVSIREGNSKAAKLKFDKTRGSVYAREADEAYTPFFTKTVDATIARLDAKSDNCRDFNRVLGSETEARGKHVTDEARKKVACKREVVAKGSNQNPGSAKQPPEAACDAGALTVQGRDAFQSGNFQSAVKLFEQSLSCKFDQGVVPQLVLAACTSKNLAKARLYYPKLSTSQQPSIVQRCLDNKIDPR